MFVSLLTNPALNLRESPGELQPKPGRPPAGAESRMGAACPPPRVAQTEQCCPDYLFYTSKELLWIAWEPEKIIERERERKTQTLIQIWATYFQSPQTHYTLTHRAALSTVSTGGDKTNPTSRNLICSIVLSSPTGKQCRTQKGRSRDSHGTKAAVWVDGCNQSPNSHPA